MPINFTVTDDLFASSDDTDDVGIDADVVPLIGPVKFTPQFRDDRAVLAPSASPRPAGFKIRSFTGYMDDDGQLKSRPGGTVGVRLWANDPLFGINELWYKVEYDLATPIGQTVKVAGGYLKAPTTDTVKSLVSELQQTGSTGVGVTRGVPGPGVDDVTVNGDGDVVFWVDGDAVGDPLDLDVLVFDMTSIDGGTADAEGLETIDGGGPEVSGSTVDLKRMQQRRGLATAWTSGDPILSAAEFGVSFNVDGSVAALKLGDGIQHWSTLKNLLDAVTAAQLSSAVAAAVAGLVNGAPGTLDALNELAAALGNDPNFAATIATALAGKQPLDSDLTAIAALTTAAFGRSLLTAPDAATVRTAIGAGTGGGDASTNTASSVDSELALFSGTGGKTFKRATASGIAKLTAGVLGTATAGTDYQAADSDLTAIAALTTTTYGRAFLALADAAAARTATGAAKRLTFNVDDYGADPTGATSSNTAIAAARTAMGTSAGVLEFGVGTYAYTTPIAAFGPYQGVKGQGRSQTLLKFSGTGDAIRARDTRAFSSFPAFLPGGSGGPGWGGEFTGFTIDGTGSGTASTGLHIGDLTGVKLDAAVINFNGTSQIGIWMHNQVTWLEKLDADVHTHDCTKHIVFDGGTFDYGTKFQAAVALYPNQDGVTLRNDVSMMGVSLKIVGGCVNDTTNTGTVLVVGKDNSDGAHFRGHLDIDVESGIETTGVAHKTIAIGAAASVVGYGSLHFYRRPSPIIQWTSGTGVARMAFTGHIDVDDAFGRSLALQGARTVGLFTGARGYLDPSGDMYLDGGNWYAAQLTAGARTLNMIYASATLGYPQAGSFDLFLQQPASGSSTVTWPAGFTWLDGAAPTLSTTPNAVDHIHVTTADFGTFYAKHVNAAPSTSALRFSSIKDTNGNAGLDIAATASAVNRLRANNAAAGAAPGIEAVGSDTNISISLAPKGTGGLYSWVNSQSALYYTVDGSSTDVSVVFQPKGAGRLYLGGALIPSVSSTDTLTNKRVTARIGTVASSATPTINTDNVDQFNITALAAAITSFTTNLSGTPTDGQCLDIRIKGDATPRAITWGASFTGTLLTTTVANKTHLQRLKWDAAVSKWAGYLADGTGY